MVLKKTYRGKRVLITGHTGFKGSWLSIWLNLLGAEVIGYALEPPSEPSNFEACGLADKFVHLLGDVRDYDHLVSVFKTYGPEFVFHLAAQPIVRLSYAEPRYTYETNVLGTVNVLEAARAAPSVRVLVNVTSDKCYENRELNYAYREDNAMGGHDPYSSSKGCAELVTAAYLRSFFPPEEYGKSHHVALASARAGNVIGGGDWGADRLVPDCVRALSKGAEVFIRYPRATRPWQYVLEPLRGYLLLGAKLWTDSSRYVGAWNFGPSDEKTLTVEEVVKEIIRRWGQGSYRVDPGEHPHEDHWLKLDCAKAKSHLSWHLLYSVDEALTHIVKWYQNYYVGTSHRDMWDFTVKQINQYMAATE